MKTDGVEMRQNSRVAIRVTLWVIVVLIASCAANGVRVQVINGSGSELTKVELRFTGGKSTTPLIKAGGTFSDSIRPIGDSHLEVLFVDRAGQVHLQKIGVYLSPGIKGSIAITLGADGKVSWKDSTHL